MLGTIGIQEARARAAEAELDLVEVQPNAEPPVCKIMDFDKYRYDRQKSMTVNRKRKPAETKEIRFRPVTGSGDCAIKMRNILKFLQDGHRVRVTVQFRGREASHPEVGIGLLQQLAGEIATAGFTVEGNTERPPITGRTMGFLAIPAATNRTA